MSSPISIQKKASTASNVLELMRDTRAFKEVSQGYRQIRRTLIWTGFVLIVFGAIALAVERVILESTESETLSVLAYGYNTTLIIGAALLSGVAFHTLAKRKDEHRRITSIKDRIEEIKINRVKLLNEMEEQ